MTCKTAMAFDKPIFIRSMHCDSYFTSNREKLLMSQFIYIAIILQCRLYKSWGVILRILSIDIWKNSAS